MIKAKYGRARAVPRLPSVFFLMVALVFPALAQERPLASTAPAESVRAIDVVVRNAAAGIDLAGTLLLPAGVGPFPAVSGAQNRDEELLGHKPFKAIAEYLAGRGVASLRCDDRGVGASGGNFAAATTFDFASDARAAVAFLAGRPEIDARRVGLVGHSEGGLIAAIVGAEDPALSFIAMLAGPGLRGDRLLLAQNAALAAASGMGAEAIAAANALNARLYAIAVKAEEPSAVRAEIVAAMTEAMGGAIPAAVAERAADQLLNPWTRAFLAIDPADYLSKVRIPALALNGTKDLQVPAEANLAAIGRALDAAGNKAYSLVSLEGLNHLFQRAKTGLPQEYAAIAEDFAPEALAALGDWILATTR
ncbi:alpha/beta hydrolase [bacterium]|nr:alpha/beta hydrolase [bacterium]